MSPHVTEARFLNDVANHAMTVIRDDGVYRHIQFRRPGTVNYRFDLLTWPGHLAITGDMGTYVFSRLQDMFEFFRTDRIHGRNDGRTLFVNPGYWGEKLVSVCPCGGYRRYDADVFRQRVQAHFDSWVERRALPDAMASEPEIENFEQGKNDLWDAIESDVLSFADYGEIDAYSVVRDFFYNGFEFVDFFDAGGTESYTFSYLWCIYAIAWGVARYDEAANSSAAVAERSTNLSKLL